jgi:uncharacterized protein YegP (UPF0339 family)
MTTLSGCGTTAVDTPVDTGGNVPASSVAAAELAPIRSTSPGRALRVGGARGNEARNRGGSKVAGVFEIAATEDESYFFKLTAPDGTVLAVSPPFNSVRGAAAGITAVRENAATGLVVDRSQT